MQHEEKAASVVWFLHLVMNQFGEIMSTFLSNEHTVDFKMVEGLVTALQGKLFADLGYISQGLKLKLIY